MFSLARIRGALLLIAPVALLQAQATAPAKLAYVDSRYIVNGAPGTPIAQAMLQREVGVMEAQVKRMSDSLDVLTTAFTKDQATLSGDKRDARVKVINDRQNEYQQRYQALQQQAQDREAEVMQPILDQVKIALEDVRVEMGLTMILDISQSGVLVAADKNLNVSDRVLAKLRTMPVPTFAEKGAAGTGKADPKAGKAPTGPVQGPAGIGGKAPAGAKAPAKPDSVPPKKPDSTATKRPESR
jgi:outer membrane protein